tara:strand:+ start:40 stop:2112 length:2073 start_codon:yes stop_codon:yes gene_type:complete
VAQANVKLTVDASQATRALKGVQAQSTGLQRSFGALKTAIAGVAVTAVAKQAVTAATNFQALQIRMKVLTSEFGEFAQVQELVSRAQDKFNLSIIEATKGITDIFARLRPLGVSLEDIEKTFMGFNSIAKVAGLNAVEASAAFTQLAQGLGSGRLQGDEFRSIAEQVPQLLKAISDETGIATGKLKDFASKGLLKSDIIIRALSKSADGLSEQIESIMSESPAERFKEFNNAVLELQLSLGTKLLPTVLKVTKGATVLVEALVGFVDSKAAQVIAIMSGFALAVKAVTVVTPIAAALVATLKLKLVELYAASLIAGTNLGTASIATQGLGIAALKASTALTVLKGAIASTGVGLLIVALGGLITSLVNAGAKAKEFNTLLNDGSVDQLQTQIQGLNAEIDELQSKEDFAKIFGVIPSPLSLDEFIKRQGKLNELKQLENALTIRNGEAERKAILEKDKIAQNTINKIGKENDLIRARIEGNEEEISQKQRIDELVEKTGEEHRAAITHMVEQNAELKKQEENLKVVKDEAERIKGIFTDIGNDIATGISDALVDAIEGTRSLGEAARAIVNDLASSLLRLGVNTLLKSTGFGLFANLPGLANGGPASAGRSYLVGERGPEIFTPKRSGQVIPNNQIGGGGGIVNNINVNVDASGSSVEGNTGESEQLGRVLSTAIQTELIKQQRPGGLLA